MNLKDLLIQEYKTFAPTAPSNIASSVREESMKQLGEMGIPSIKMEEWKYTNLKSILETPFAIKSATEISKDAIHFYNIDAYRLVFVNGILNTTLSDTKGLEEFATLSSIADAIYKH